MKALELMKADIEEFNEAFGHDPTPTLQLKLCIEEATELLEASLAMHDDPTPETGAAFLKEYIDLGYVGLGIPPAVDTWSKDEAVMAEFEEFIKDNEEHLEFMQSAFDACSAAARLFIPDDVAEVAWEIVHESNMSKVGPDGKASYDENGKVMKPDDYVAPDLTDLGTEVANRYMDYLDTLEEAA